MKRHMLLRACAAAVALAFSLPAFGASYSQKPLGHRPQARDTCNRLARIPEEPGTVRTGRAEVERAIDDAAEAAFVSVVFSAVKSGDAARVKPLVDLSRSVLNARDDRGRTPLHWAARNGSLPVLSLLVEKGADVNAVDNDRMTALHSLAANGNVEGLRILLDNGANPDVTTAEGDTPLQLAAEAHRAEAVRLLTKRKSGASAPAAVRTPS